MIPDTLRHLRMKRPSWKNESLPASQESCSSQYLTSQTNGCKISSEVNVEKEEFLLMLEKSSWRIHFSSHF